MSKVNPNDIADFNLMTYGFPCQDISVAGRQNGFSENSDTRSSLLWEAMKIAKAKKPKYMIAENVKNLIGRKFKDDFDKWINMLDELGYNTYYEVLNAKDFGIPQNRERVFVISIRKDIEANEFTFPVGKDEGIRLKDVLEQQIGDKYYLSEEVQKRFKFNEKYNPNTVDTTAPEFRTIGQSDIVYGTEGVMGTLLARDYKQPKQIIEVVGELDIKGQDVIKRVYSSEGLSPTLTTMQGGNRQPKVIEKEENKLNFVGGIGEKDWVGDGKGLSRNYPQGNRVYDSNGIAASQTANGGGLGGKTGLYLENNFAIRKLTPKECWRLMGFTDNDFNTAKESLNQEFYKGKDRSDSQLYKQAGNSIVINVAEAIFKEMKKSSLI
ncbi:DNA (cytosine-5-)-methyltransferase [Halalkalibacter oceani]|uniref:DNA (cytosine-5-)-methyltransferase n=1 Tax=Halalkalibacter oceani TaxID=1653776 RepID=UPI003F495D46